MKQYISELAAMSLFLISLLWILGTAGMSDWDKISISQCIWRLAVGVIGLAAAAIWINSLPGTREEVQDGEDNQH
jgi:hypothetical protein